MLTNIFSPRGQYGKKDSHEHLGYVVFSKHLYFYSGLFELEAGQKDFRGYYLYFSHFL